MMSYWPDRQTIIVTLYTLVVGAIGAGVEYWLSLPVFILTGPAILVSFMGVTNIRFAVADVVRDVAFVFIGIGIGASVNAQATAAFLAWPLAFVGLVIMLVAIVVICRFLLTNYFGFDRRSAVLAATPGHLSFVISLGNALNLNVGKVAVVHSVRLLALTLLVPFTAVTFGVEIEPNILPPGMPMQNHHLIALLAASLTFGLVLKRFNVPAALLIGSLAVSSFAHIMDITPGVLSPAIALPCFMIMATMIGTRFSGVTFSLLKQGLLAGLATTAVASLLATIAALPVAAILGMPVTHVIVAFAPGGLETMIAMGAVLGANPGFVAACHVGRLLFLTVLVPFFLGRKIKAD